MSHRGNLSGRRILVVEDEMIVAWLLEDMLADLGCTVLGPAAGVPQALAILGAVPLDAAVLDVNLGGQKSFPIADALAVRRVPFAFSTGYQKDSLPPGYRAAPLLHKPFDQAALAAALGRLLVRAAAGAAIGVPRV